MNTYPEHIVEFANKMLAKGAKMTFDAICQMELKSEAKKAKKQTSKKEAAKWDQRAAVEANAGSTYSGRTIAEINRDNAIKSLPSSLR